METAKVDIRKLQLLNDRINQTLEALQQVRLSVHGIQHSAGIGHGFGQAQLPFGYGWGMAPQINPLAQQMSPQFASPFAQVPAWAAQQPFGPFGLGIGHSSPEELQRFADPTLPYRVASAFPYAYAAVPPLVALY